MHFLVTFGGHDIGSNSIRLDSTFFLFIVINFLQRSGHKVTATTTSVPLPSISRTHTATHHQEPCKPHSEP